MIPSHNYVQPNQGLSDEDCESIEIYQSGDKITAKSFIFRLKDILNTVKEVNPEKSILCAVENIQKQSYSGENRFVDLLSLLDYMKKSFLNILLMKYVVFWKLLKISKQDNFV